MDNALVIRTLNMKQEYLFKDFLETLDRKQSSFYNQFEINW